MRRISDGAWEITEAEVCIVKATERIDGISSVGKHLVIVSIGHGYYEAWFVAVPSKKLNRYSTKKS